MWSLSRNISGSLPLLSLDHTHCGQLRFAAAPPLRERPLVAVSRRFAAIPNGAGSTHPAVLQAQPQAALRAVKAGYAALAAGAARGACNAGRRWNSVGNAAGQGRNGSRTDNRTASTDQSSPPLRALKQPGTLLQRITACYEATPPRQTLPSTPSQLTRSGVICGIRQVRQAAAQQRGLHRVHQPQVGLPPQRQLGIVCSKGGGR